MNTQIETVTGRFFDVANPQVSDVSAHDIAWALSREPRFGSHSISEVPYTVGQHSLCVMRLIERAMDSTTAEWASAYDFFTEHFRHNALALSILDKPNSVLKYPSDQEWVLSTNKILLAALLHDASEAYLRDLPSPVKHIPGLREAYKAAEDKVQRAVFEAFELECGDKNLVDCKPLWDVIHWADLYCRTIEAYHFMPSRGKGWVDSIPLSLVQLQDFEYPKRPLDVYQEMLIQFEQLRKFVQKSFD